MCFFFFFLSFKTSLEGSKGQTLVVIAENMTRSPSGILMSCTGCFLLFCFGVFFPMIDTHGPYLRHKEVSFKSYFDLSILTEILTPEVHHLFEVGDIDKTVQGGGDSVKEGKREMCSEMQLICNAGRIFGDCMSNVSALHRNTITRAAHRRNAKWDITDGEDLRNTELSTRPFNET